MRVLIELIETAATWDELEYSEGEVVIQPRDWVEFAEVHTWVDRSRILDAMIAVSSYAPRRTALSAPAPVTPLFAVSDESLRALVSS